MSNFRFQSAALGSAVLIVLTAACGSDAREFGTEGTAGAANSVGTAGVPNSAGAAGASPDGAGGSGGGSAGETASANAGGVGGSGGIGGGDGLSGEGGAVGQSRAGNGSGTGGNGGETCSPFTCCIADRVFQPNEVSPINVCDICLPGENQHTWSIAKGKTCDGGTGVAVAPKSEGLWRRSCGGSCSLTGLTMRSSVKVKFKGSGPGVTTDEYLELDFSNIVPSQLINVSKAVLRLHTSASIAGTEGVSLLVGSTESASATCTLAVTKLSTPALVQCDVTEVVKGWLASPASKARALDVTATGTGDVGAQVKTHMEPNALLRPSLVIDYTAKCDGHTCPELE